VTRLEDRLFGRGDDLANSFSRLDALSQGRPDGRIQFIERIHGARKPAQERAVEDPGAQHRIRF
jgi:hypothetical protein